MSYDLYKWSYITITQGQVLQIQCVHTFDPLMVGFVTNNLWCRVIRNHWVSQFQRANGVSTNQYRAASANFCDDLTFLECKNMKNLTQNTQITGWLGTGDPFQKKIR